MIQNAFMLPRYPWGCTQSQNSWSLLSFFVFFSFSSSFFQRVIPAHLFLTSLKEQRRACIRAINFAATHFRGGWPVAPKCSRNTLAWFLYLCFFCIFVLCIFVFSSVFDFFVFLFFRIFVFSSGWTWTMPPKCSRNTLARLFSRDALTPICLRVQIWKLSAWKSYYRPVWDGNKLPLLRLALHCLK